MSEVQKSGCKVGYFLHGLPRMPYVTLVTMLEFVRVLHSNMVQMVCIVLATAVASSAPMHFYNINELALYLQAVGCIPQPPLPGTYWLYLYMCIAIVPFST